MSRALYELLSGSVNRRSIKNPDERITYEPGGQFVPSPGEFAVIKNRIKQVGTVEDDSPEFQEALLNTNLLDHPEFAAAASKSNVKAITINVDDIRKIDETPEALALVNATTEIKTLDRFHEQESNNKPRVRKVVILAIAKRKKELQEISTTA